MITDEPDPDLSDLQDKLLAAREAASEALERRDGEIARLLADGRSVRSLAKAAGITRQQVMRIREQVFPGENQDTDALFELPDGGGSLD